MIDSEKLSLAIANKNSPKQVVLSGATVEIERAEKLMADRGIRSKRLCVAAAFHSALVSDAEKPFATALGRVEFSAGQLPVFANSTGLAYPTDAASARELLASQLARPVEFVNEIEQMYASGVRAFIEVGPGGKLSGLVNAILGEREHVAVALDASSGKRSGVFDLGCLLAQLAAAGHHVDLTRWDAAFAARVGPPETKKPAMTMRLSGANYVKPRTARAAVTPTNANASATKTPVTKTAVPVQERGRVALNHTPASESNHSHPPTAHGTIAPAANLSALQATQQSILMLQKMQEQTARLHEQYLHGQETAQQTIHQLIEQQMRLLGGASAVAKPAPLAAPRIVQPVAIAPVNGARHDRAASVEAVAAPAAKAAVIAPPIRLQPWTPPVARNGAPHETARNGAAEKVLLEVIAEKTGYPVEMLELDMSLDADLGIDSIKRVEILSALQTRLPEAPVVKPEDLGRLQTLRQIVVFLSDGVSTKAAVNGEEHPVIVASSNNAVTAKTTANADRSTTVLLEVVAEKTGYPVEMLELDMSLDADLGIDSIKRVEILSALQTRMPEAPVVKPEDLGRLQTLRQIVGFLQSETSVAMKEVVATPDVTFAVKHNVEDGLDRQVLTVVPLNGETVRAALPLAKGAIVWVTDDGAGLSAGICAALVSRNLDAKLVALNVDPAASGIAGLLIVAPRSHRRNLFSRHLRWCNERVRSCGRPALGVRRFLPAPRRWTGALRSMDTRRGIR